MFLLATDKAADETEEIAEEDERDDGGHAFDFGSGHPDYDSDHTEKSAEKPNYRENDPRLACCTDIVVFGVFERVECVVQLVARDHSLEELFVFVGFCDEVSGVVVPWHHCS